MSAVRYRIPTPKIVYDTMEGEAIILHLDTGIYYSLSGAGAVIWNDLGRGLSLPEIVRRLAQTYSAAPGEIETAVENLVRALAAEQLIVPLEDAMLPARAADEPSPSAAPLTALPFVAPSLDKYNDIQNLLLFDPIYDMDEQGWPILSTDNNAG